MDDKEWDRKGIWCGGLEWWNGQQLGLKDSDDRDGKQMEKKAEGTGKKEKREKNEQGWIAIGPAATRLTKRKSSHTREKNSHEREILKTPTFLT